MHQFKHKFTVHSHTSRTRARTQILANKVLLTYENLNVRFQFRNAENTFSQLFSYNVIPIVNENDTVAVQELRFGDNDKLSAMVASMLCADWLFILTDVDGLYSANPSTNPDASLITKVDDIGSINADYTTKGSDWGTGGMMTKIAAARISFASGVRSVISNANSPGRMLDAINNKSFVGTMFVPNTISREITMPAKGYKRWILSLTVKGALILDSGAVEAVRKKNSLFAKGFARIDSSSFLFYSSIISISSLELILAFVRCEFSY